MPPTLTSRARQNVRRLRYWASTVHWFAVLALLAVLAGLTASLTHQSDSLVTALGAAALTLAVLAIREE